MKKSILYLIIPILFGMQFHSTSLSQNAGKLHLNNQLRTLFGSLNLPPNPKLFLYDMSCHTSDSIFYQTRCQKSISTGMWFGIYEEMYYSAYDTTKFIDPATFYLNSQQFYADTIPIGLMHYGFYKLKTNALNTNIYFNFNLSNNTISDKNPRPSFPYLDSNIFAASPLVRESYFSNPVFRIDPDFLLFDHHNANKYGKEFQFAIDFGDGAGWVKFDPSIVSHHSVNYSKSGEKTLQVAIINTQTSALVHYSFSKVNIITSQKKILPNSSFKVPGLNVGVYSGCNSRGLKSGKVIIYLPGFDILDGLPSFNRDIPRIYAEMISNNKIVQLKNQGYTFLVVDWNRSSIDMRFNALYLVNLMEKLKCDLDEGQQFVMMGESMGGLIARYALTYMESNAYKNQDVSMFFNDAGDVNNSLYLSLNPGIFTLPQKWCLTDKKHNTRLLITLDAPHQGANIPISVQHAYRTALDAIGKLVKFDLQAITTYMNLFLESQAAQQMLIYHVDTKQGSTYTSHNDKIDFFNELSQMGNYPEYCKVTALSNGSLQGEPQTNYYNGQDRFSGDNLLNLDGALYLRVLGQKLKLIHAELDCKTNAGTNTEVFKAMAYLNKFQINLFVFGVHIGITPLYIVNESVYSNAKAYCVNSGGFTGDPLFISSSSSSKTHNSSNSWMMNLMHYNYTPLGNGCITADAHLGWNGFLSANIDFAICSDGFHFTLVPTQSALDYGTLGNFPLNHDIEGENINTKLSRFKTDVSMGYSGSGNFLNQNHIGRPREPFINPMVYNITQTKSPHPNYDHTYYTCINYNDVVQRGIINMEIGDEELYLENVTLPWTSTYETEFDINVNERNPYYQYQNGFSSTIRTQGIYSKDDPFTITSTGEATFITDALNSPTRKGLKYNAPFTGRYYQSNNVMNICCIDFIGSRMKEIDKKAYTLDPISYLKVFPNPNNGEFINIRFRSEEEGNPVVEIYDLSGRLVFSKTLNQVNKALETTSRLSLNSPLIPGMYLIRLRINAKELSTLLTIQN